MPMATKIGRVVTCGGGTPTSKSHDLLMMWSRDKFKTLYLLFCNIYDHKAWQSSNLQWGGPNLQSHVTFWLCGQVTNLKSLYLHVHNIYGHQTFDNGVM